MSAGGLWASAVGLALLYASAFYFPQIGIESSYWLPEAGRQILYPSAIALLALTPAAAWWQLHGYADGGQSGPLGLIVLAVLCWITILGAFSAAGYSAISIALIVTGGADNETTRWGTRCPRNRGRHAGGSAPLLGTAAARLDHPRIRLCGAGIDSAQSLPALNLRHPRRCAAPGPGARGRDQPGTGCRSSRAAPPAGGLDHL